MKMKTIGAIFVALALVGLPALAGAAIVTYSAQDDGVYPGPWPNSAAAEASFKTAAAGLGPINTITFESLATGFYTPFAAAPGVTATISAPNVGDGYSGISITTLGQLYGFNTTSGGANWFGFPEGSATFDFAAPTQSFGMYITGVQTVFTSTFTVSFDDGAPQLLNLPINVDGGAAYFGFTDAGAPFSSITITNLSVDAWGIDDVTYNAVPIPPAAWLFGSGLLGLVGWRRFKKA
jgi:hypothetical protein